VNADADNWQDVQWVAQCARRLREQWPHADVLSLEEAAADLWRVDWLRQMTPAEAAELWLYPMARLISSHAAFAPPTAFDPKQPMSKHICLPRSGHWIRELRSSTGNGDHRREDRLGKQTSRMLWATTCCAVRSADMLVPGR
jgi:hypothetical protein